MRVENEPPRIAGGAALAKAITVSKAKDTPERHKLVVYVFDATATPAPTCATIASGSELFNVRGAYFTFTVDKAVDGPGTFDVSDLEWSIHTAEKNAKSSPEHKSLRVALTLQSYDAKSFAGALTSRPGSAGDVSGSIVGTVCPSSTEQPLDADGFPLPADGDSAPPPPPPPPPAATTPEKKPKGKPKPR
ncbi:MAG: hypothetical protein QOI41_2557 [Myxococcales bacterium]|nr:hypothetical protein [Myxococcales bacterium]